MRLLAVTGPRSEFERTLSRLFEVGTPGKWDVIETAIRGRSRPTLLIALIDIPDRLYKTLDELWAVVAADIDRTPEIGNR